MSKRQLGNRYKDLVDYINEHKDDFELMKILKHIFEGTNLTFWNPDIEDTEEYKMMFSIYNGDFDWTDRDKLVPIITDIYNDNYELEEPKYYWKLNINGSCSQNYYAYEYHYVAPHIGIDSDKNMADRFTKTEFNNFLSHTQTNLTIDNFTPVEEIEND